MASTPGPEDVRLTIVPRPTSETVQNFVPSVAAGRDPLLLQVDPMPGGRPQDCFWNVDQMVKAEGGHRHYGWIIWEIPHVMIEAEFHAVWKRPDGSLRDPTPQRAGEDEILFLPDPNHPYDGQVVPNRRRALHDDPLVHDFMELGRLKEEAIRNSDAEYGEEFSVPMSKFRERVTNPRAVLEGFFSLAVRLRERNDPCVCGSGQKFKKCCWFDYR